MTEPSTYLNLRQNFAESIKSYRKVYEDTTRILNGAGVTADKVKASELGCLQTQYHEVLALSYDVNDAMKDLLSEISEVEKR